MIQRTRRKAAWSSVSTWCHGPKLQYFPDIFIKISHLSPASSQKLRGSWAGLLPASEEEINISCLKSYLQWDKMISGSHRNHLRKKNQLKWIPQLPPKIPLASCSLGEYFIHGKCGGTENSTGCLIWCILLKRKGCVAKGTGQVHGGIKGFYGFEPLFHTPGLASRANLQCLGGAGILKLLKKQFGGILWIMYYVASWIMCEISFYVTPKVSRQNLGNELRAKWSWCEEMLQLFLIFHWTCVG